MRKHAKATKRPKHLRGEALRLYRDVYPAVKHKLTARQVATLCHRQIEAFKGMRRFQKTRSHYLKN